MFETSSHLLLLFIPIFDISNALRCYQCGSEAVFMDYNAGSEPLPASQSDQLEDTALKLESCSNLEFTFASWGMYAVDCPPEQICVKTILDRGFDETGTHNYGTATRGCAMRNTSRGQEHPMGCGVLQTNVVLPSETVDRMDLVCFCETDFCNGADKIERINRFLVVVGAISVILCGNISYPLLA